jgi:hypothetical protein
MEGPVYWGTVVVGGVWHGGWNDGASHGVFLTGMSVVDPSSTAFQTYVAAHAPQPQSSAVQTISFVVGMGVGVACSLSGGGAIFAGSAGMAVGNATGALLNGLLTGQSADQIVLNTFLAGATGAIAGAVGGAASMLIAPVATGLVGTLGLTCENGFGFVGAAVIGGADGAAFGASSSFTQVAISTNDLNQAIDAAGEGALLGGFLGGAISVGLNAIDPFVCFDAGTQVVAEFEKVDGESNAQAEGDLRENFDGGDTALALLASTVARLAKKLRYITRNVEDVQENDYIASRDQNNPDAPLVLSRVERVFKRLADHLRILAIRDMAGREQVLRTTDEHPFHSDRIGWAFAKALQVGDFVVGPCGISGTLIATHREEHPEGVWVYNLRIEGTHTYFVRAKDSNAEPVWVHNANYDSFNTLEGDELASIDGAHHLDDFIDEFVGNYQDEAAGQALLSEEIQNHHLITNQMVDALDRVGFQGGQALRARQDLQYLSSPGGHVGYEEWHRILDDDMVAFIYLKRGSLTESGLLEFIQNYYQDAAVAWRIPGVNLGF